MKGNMGDVFVGISCAILTPSPGKSSPHWRRTRRAPSLCLLLTGAVLLDAKSKVIKSEFSFTSWLTSRKDLHG